MKTFKWKIKQNKEIIELIEMQKVKNREYKVWKRENKRENKRKINNEKERK